MTFGKILTREKLNTEYWDNHKSAPEIASDFDCDGRTILKWMVRYNVPRRKPGERANGEFTLKKGHEAWNKDKTKKEYPQIKGGLLFQEGHTSWNKGRNNLPECSEATKRKISEAHQGEKHPLYGKHHSKEAREKMSKSHIGLQAGENHPNWQGGISRLPYPFDFNKELKELIRKRDNYKCQFCGTPQAECLKKLCIHHINYDKNDLDPKNLIALCRRCHSKVNFNRDYWMNILTGVIL